MTGGGAAGRLHADHRARPAGRRTPGRASSTCWPPRSGGAGEWTSAPTCRGPSRTRGRARARLASCSRRSGPGPSGWPSWRAGRACTWSARWAWAAPAGAGRVRCSWAAASARRRCCACRTSSGRGAPVLLGFRSAAHAEAAVALRRRARARHRRRLRRPRTGSSPTCCARSSTRDPAATVFACGPPPMLEAVRALCAERGVPAQLALESGMACGFGACFGCVVPTKEGYIRAVRGRPVLDGRRPLASRAYPRGRGIDRATGPCLWRSSPLGPGPVLNGSGHLRRPRRPPRLRRRAARALPLPRLRLEDDHARAAPGQPAAAPLGDPGRPDQLDRPSQQGPGGLPRLPTCPSSPSCRCR